MLTHARPMSDAPRDGRPVLLRISGHWIEGRWCGYEWELIHLASFGCGCCSQSDPEPDAWAPLPQFRCDWAG